jgi:uncharacterized membrane protein YqiK
MQWQTILILGGGGFVLLLGIFALVAKFYVKIEQGQALIVNKTTESIVTFTGATVYPIVHKAEVMDISVKTIEIDRRGKDGLICMDNIRADIKVTFFVRVNHNRDDVLKVAQSIGCTRASHQETLEELFTAKFSEALKTVGKLIDFEDLYNKRDHFKDQIIQVIGTDLNGYSLEDAAIDYLEQTPVEALDPQNILDAVGIKKITDITTKQNVLTNDFKQIERKAITKQNVEADEAVFELERQRAEAEAKKLREIATVQSREQAETLKVQAEEMSRSERARIKAEEEIKVEEENKERQVQVAGKNRERVVAVENERVTKARDLEAISREREVELQRIDKEKALEVEKKKIADVVRERVAVDKTVAEEEERILDVRAIAGAERQKEVVKLTAEGQALDSLVREVKAAEAKQEAAKHEAQVTLITATADLEASDKQAQAQIRLAEGAQAEQAASGLAVAKVKEADALAEEKQGMTKVRVKEADAGAEEKQGLALVHVREAEADAIQKRGLAEALVTKEKMLAEAAGTKGKGMAGVQVREANATAVEKLGLAEALAIKEKLTAEATGLGEKAEAMKQLDGVGREHEEFRLRLDKEKVVDLESLNIRRDVAEAQAKILSQAFAHAKINIVGGDGAFFDKFIKAVSLGQTLDGVMNNSETLQTAARDYLEGNSSLSGDIKDVLSRPAVNADSLQKLTISALLGKLMLGADDAGKGKLKQLIETARKLGIDELDDSK